MGKNQPLTLPYPLILASTSKYRGELLSRLGWDFKSISPEVDEDLYKNQSSSPEKLATLLSRLKAQAVFKKYPGSCVIGSDQVCEVEGHILGKPGQKAKASMQLQSLQGRSHQLLTAVTIMSPEGEETFVNKTQLFMRQLTQKNIEDYLDQDTPYDCAGSYKLESRGIALFHKIEMSDYTAIIGLPLMEVTTHLLKLGFPL